MGNWKKVVLSAYEEYGYPMMKEFVLKTDNTWDDTVLEAVNSFLVSFLSAE